MSETNTMVAAGARSKPDPFNWPTQSRKDCMALSSLEASKDLVQTRTKAFRE